MKLLYGLFFISCIGVWGTHSADPKTSDYDFSADCQANAGSDYHRIRHPNKCSLFYDCQENRIKSCGSNSVFSTLSNFCTFRESSDDDCTPVGKPPGPNHVSAEDRCEQGETVFPHPDECALYYNCTSPLRRTPVRGQKYLRECPYPKLFSTETLRCEEFECVQCGIRNEPITACDYILQRCTGAMCQPCKFSLPSCLGLTDGIHFNPNQPWQADYIICKSGRTIAREWCPSLNGVRHLFSPVTLKCVSVMEVPVEHGGRLGD